MDSHIKVYVETLFENKNIAYPVWYPQPQPNSSRYGEVQLADVGFMSRG
jgi:hypothetical protein